MTTPLKYSIQYRRDLWKLFTTRNTADLTGVVEVGVAEGNFSEDILNWPTPFPNVWLVDRWMSRVDVKGDSAMPQAWHDKNHQRVLQRTEKFEGRAKIMRMESTQAAEQFSDGVLDLVYIDADHSYGGCKADIHAWYRKVKRGGIMAFHDYMNPAYGVKRAVDEFVKQNALIAHFMQEDKPEDAGAYFIC